jgi:hypothetical protein
VKRWQRATLMAVATGVIGTACVLGFEALWRRADDFGKGMLGGILVGWITAAILKGAKS